MTRFEIFLTAFIISCDAQNGGFSVSNEAKMIYNYGISGTYFKVHLYNFFSKIASGILRFGALSWLLDVASKRKSNLWIRCAATTRLLDLHCCLALERLLPKVGRNCCSNALIAFFMNFSFWCLNISNKEFPQCFLPVLKIILKLLKKQNLEKPIQKV